MGQKGSKSSTTAHHHHHLIRDLNSNLIKLNVVASDVGCSSASSSSAASSASSSYSASSKSKSNHESAISNDSGCYIADRLSSPSGSSVLCIFDMANESALKKANGKCVNTAYANKEPVVTNDLTIKKRVKRNEKGGNGELGSRSKTLTRDMTSSSQTANVIIAKNSRPSQLDSSKRRTSNRTKSTSSQTNEESNRFSFCDSLDYSYSLNSSSSSCLNLETIDENLSSSSASSGSNKYKLASRNENKIIDGDEIDYLQVAAHSLCDQLNQILSISAGLALDSINFNNRQEFLEKLANVSKSSKSKNDLFKKTLSSAESANLSQSDLSVAVGEELRRSRIEQVDDKTSNSASSSSNQSTKIRFISRSHTFHAEQNVRRRLNPTKTNQCLDNSNKRTKSKPSDVDRPTNLKLVSNEDEIVELEKLDGYKTAKMNNSSKTAARNLLKNGRRLFTWNRKSSANSGVHSESTRKQKNDFDRTETPYLFNNVRANSLEEQVINLIAAKLMSENIELAQQPYSDELGFCKIPIALVRRYSIELKKSVDLVAKCMETERLSQLEKCGKIGIPNDFLVDSCKCAAIKSLSSEAFESSKTDSSSWQACKCDLDLSTPGSFFNRIGLPMYAEIAMRNFRHNCSPEEYFKNLFKKSSNEIEQEYNIENKLHMNIIESTIQIAKNYFLN